MSGQFGVPNGIRTRVAAHVRFDRDGDGVAEDGWFDVSYQPARDFDGKVSGVLSLSIDVTDRARSRPA